MNIDYQFQNPKLLETALTHISLANEHGIQSNQRLEFLGDSITAGAGASAPGKTYAAVLCEKIGAKDGKFQVNIFINWRENAGDNKQKNNGTLDS